MYLLLFMEVHAFNSPRKLLQTKENQTPTTSYATRTLAPWAHEDVLTEERASRCIHACVFCFQAAAGSRWVSQTSRWRQ